MGKRDKLQPHLFGATSLSLQSIAMREPPASGILPFLTPTAYSKKSFLVGLIVGRILDGVLQGLHSQQEKGRSFAWRLPVEAFSSLG